MRIVLAVLMALHGLAHLVGFVGSWRLARLEGMTYKTTVLGGRLDLGDAGIRAVGVLWLVLAIGFLIAAIGAIGSRSWWVPAALMAVGVSLALCFLQWPDSRIGVPVNLVILIAVLVARRYGAL